ncbi:MAG: glutamate-5-semialdehyde dehydrogenase [Propionibacteriaceae bacterium]|jgi:glutamate-5-semialdehyde dehydrogenase|nr:glutamate-5-semialdehyde dehydrogenase [Propionibacteriaceae bacterium]
MTTDFLTQAAGARAAAVALATATRATKDAALEAMADALLAAEPAVLAANAADVGRARAAGTEPALIDRLALDPARVAGMAAGLRDLRRLADPVGEVVRGWQLANGVHVDQVRVPLGVVGIIYEARPNVTADAAGICLKAGNAALLRGSSSAIESNRAIVQALRTGLEAAGLDPRTINLVEGGHAVTDEMMTARGLVDVLVPRGGAALINAVVRGSQVPVIETGTGNCHLFVDSGADEDMAREIILNAKTQRPSVCNALETLLVHADIAERFLPQVVDSLVNHGVSVHGDARAQALDARVSAVPGDNWDSEFLALELRVAVVGGLDEAIAFIRHHTSGHSETIITNDAAHQRRFTAEVDAACVLVNVSSRFVDGGEFGFGAEIGISTQKLHARGPMALPEMTSTKYVIIGDGQTRR